MLEENELLPSSGAPRARGRPVDTSSRPRHVHWTDFQYAQPRHAQQARWPAVSSRAGTQQRLVCVCDELQSCCEHAVSALIMHPQQRTCLRVRRAVVMLLEHAASALTVHPRVQTLLLTRLSALLPTGTTSECMCGENTDDGTVRSRMEQEMEQERRDILELPVVSGISDMVNGKGCGFCVNLR